MQAGFVWLDEAVPGILWDAKYASEDNFTGAAVDGYAQNRLAGTVELAAAALGVAPARIAKTLSFKVGERPILVVAAGDARIDNSKYKHFFGVKARMLTPEEAVEHIGHAVGGVCPFALPEDVSVYLDESLRRFETVFPAVGSAASAIELTCPELERCCGERFCRWVDLCRGWQEA